MTPFTVSKHIRLALGTSYEWLDGELWHRGHPVTYWMTDYELAVILSAWRNHRTDEVSIGGTTQTATKAKDEENNDGVIAPDPFKPHDCHADKSRRTGLIDPSRVAGENPAALTILS